MTPTTLSSPPWAACPRLYSNCESTTVSGRLSFVAEGDNDFESMTVESGRLSTIVPCDAAAPAFAGRSGNFYDPARNGEGLFVQWLPNGQVVLIWIHLHTGRKTILDHQQRRVTVDGNTVTASMLFPAISTSFGSNFDPNEVTLLPWGTITLVYQPGCDSIDFSYVSTESAFGGGQLYLQQADDPRWHDLRFVVDRDS